MANKRLIRSISKGSLMVKTYVDPDWDEYVSQLYISDRHYKRADYYTTDKLDAIETAVEMLDRAEKSRVAGDAVLKARKFEELDENAKNKAREQGREHLIFENDKELDEGLIAQGYAWDVNGNWVHQLEDHDDYLAYEARQDREPARYIPIPHHGDEI